LLAVYLVTLSLYDLQKKSENQYYIFSDVKYTAHFFIMELDSSW